jgi:hypothetical protein
MYGETTWTRITTAIIELLHLAITDHASCHQKTTLTLSLQVLNAMFPLWPEHCSINKLGVGKCRFCMNRMQI